MRGFRRAFSCSRPKALKVATPDTANVAVTTWSTKRVFDTFRVPGIVVYTALTASCPQNGAAKARCRRLASVCWLVVLCSGNRASKQDRMEPYRKSRAKRSAPYTTAAPALRWRCLRDIQEASRRA